MLRIPHYSYSSLKNHPQEQRDKIETHSSKDIHMTILKQQQNEREWTAKRVIAELPFIPATSNWLKLLCSLLAEPLMFVSSLCIIAETVLPGAATWPGLLLNGPKTVMSLAPEIILPGCFQQAQHAQHNGDSIKGTLLFCLCALFGLLTLITLASFIWHFSGAIANLILFIRCGAGISYTIILNISGHDGKAIDLPQTSSQPAHDDRIDQLTQTVNTLTAQLTTVLSITQNNNFLVAPLQEVSQAEAPLPLTLHETRQSSMGIPSLCLSTVIQPLRVNIRKGQTDLHLLALVDQYTTVDADGVKRKPVRQGHVEVQEVQKEQIAVMYPVVPSVSAEKVKQLIDAFLRGVKWRDMPGNYSQTIKPVREAWEGLQTTLP
jgi:hypothetical protein